MSCHHYTQSQLLARGWSHRLIKTQLGGPDLTAKNTNNPDSPTKLFEAGRVREAEAGPKFIAHSIWRSSRAARNAVRKRAKTIRRLEAVANLPIRIPQMSQRDMEKVVATRWMLDHFKRTHERGDFRKLSKGTKARLCAAYLTTRASYDRSALDGLGERGLNVIEARIFEAIQRRYPELIRDCVLP